MFTTQTDDLAYRAIKPHSSALQLQDLSRPPSNTIVVPTDVHRHEHQHEREDRFESSSQQHYGLPSRKSRFSWPDFLAVLVSLLSLLAGVLVINGPWRAKLGYANQIVALGFVLGIMNLCLKRVLPYFFMLLESKYGRSTVQNYEGLMRGSPLTSKLGAIWRAILALLTVLPLVLGVLYKQYPGGTAPTARIGSNTTCLPVAPPGLQDNVEANAIMANATIPFLSASRDAASLPEMPHPYGFNLILLSEESAAALDGPSPETITALQHTLGPQDSMILSASVRGTIARYNRTAEGIRQNDNAYWDGLYKHVEWNKWNTFNGYWFGILTKNTAGGNDPGEFDCSFMIIGNSRYDGVSSDLVTDSLEKTSRRFDVTRHQCSGTWSVTRQSIELVSGDCAPSPLGDKFQYNRNSQLAVTDRLGGTITWALSPFTEERSTSHWLLPTYAALLASAWQSITVYNKGMVPIQIDGPIWQAFGMQKNSTYYETYDCYYTADRSRPTISNNAWSLYCILAVQPLMVVIAFIGIMCMHSAPIGRTFGVVSLLSGADLKTLHLLNGAGFSGELSIPVGVEIKVASSSSSSPHNGHGHGTGASIELNDNEEDEENEEEERGRNLIQRIEYRFVKAGTVVNDKLRKRTVYG